MAKPGKPKLSQMADVVREYSEYSSMQASTRAAETKDLGFELSVSVIQCFKTRFISVTSNPGANPATSKFTTTTPAL
jgi:hypothetical protein